MGLLFIFKDKNVPKNATPIVSIVEENKTIEKVEVSKKIVIPKKDSNPVAKEEEKTKKLKWCMDRSLKQVDNPPLKSFTKTNDDGDIVEIFQDYGERSYEKLYDYESGILKSKTSISHYPNDKVFKSVLNIIYDEDADIADAKQTKADIFYLTSFGNGIALHNEIDIEYHEKYDEEGKKIFAYTGSFDNMHRSATYHYDEEGNLLSKTFIHYGEGQKNTTTFYNKAGKVLSIYAESGEEVQSRWSKAKSSLIEKKKMYEKLKSKVFKQDVRQSFKYNKDGQTIEEYDGFHNSHINYIYDKYGNLIKKVKENGEILFEQSFKICEE